MMPAGPLMLEHRWIERMIRIMNEKVQQIKQSDKPDLDFIDIAVDFIRTYADKCHHGKEEDILFRDLKNKQLSDEHKRIMDELIKEHILGRNNVKKLIEAKDKYAQGDKDALNDIIANMEILIKFYPKHIEKEDKHFFIPCMDYFTEKERDNMVKEFEEFDKSINRQKYQKLVAKSEKRG